MQATRSGQAAIQRRIQNRLILIKAGLCVLEGQILKKLLRRKTDPTFEDTLKMIRAQIHTLRQFIQAWLILKVISQMLDNGFDLLILFHVIEGNKSTT
jgi:hypothetical protein